jgi:hypothetical protein
MASKRLTDDMGKGSRADLEAIEGIGERFAVVLRAHGVKNLAQLARFGTPSALVAHLRARGERKISLRHIENATGTKGDWFTQARKLLAKSRPSTARPTTAVDAGAAADDDAASPTTAGAARPATRFTTSVAVTWTPQSTTGREHIAVTVRAAIAGPDAGVLTAERSAFIVVLAGIEDDRPPVPLRIWPGRLQPEKVDYEFTGSFPVPPIGRYQMFGMVAGTSALASWESTPGPVLNVYYDTRTDEITKASTPA